MVPTWLLQVNWNLHVHEGEERWKKVCNETDSILSQGIYQKVRHHPGSNEI